jgi:hypothetical protein
VSGVIGIQPENCLQLQWADTAVKFSVSSVSNTYVHLEASVGGTLKLVPLVALYWALTADNCEQWRAAIATFTTDTAATVAALQWENADYAATGQPAITEFAAPEKMIELVFDGAAAYRSVAAHTTSIGIALYALPAFPVLGLSQRPVDIDKKHMRVCEFTVHTLGCAQPSNTSCSDAGTTSNKRARLS